MKPWSEDVIFSPSSPSSSKVDFFLPLPNFERTRGGERVTKVAKRGAVLTRKAYEREAGKYCSFSREEKRINLFIFNVRYRNAAKWAEGRGDRTVEQETDCSY